MLSPASASCRYCMRRPPRLLRQLDRRLLGKLRSNPPAVPSPPRYRSRVAVSDSQPRVSFVEIVSPSRNAASSPIRKSPRREANADRPFHGIPGSAELLAGPALYTMLETAFVLKDVGGSSTSPRKCASPPLALACSTNFLRNLFCSFWVEANMMTSQSFPGWKVIMSP